jgi:heme/copper-type cytochrome/quinol oxidase subunit 1
LIPRAKKTSPGSRNQTFAVAICPLGDFVTRALRRRAILRQTGDRASRPRRGRGQRRLRGVLIFDYPEAFAGWNYLISIGAYLGAASFLFGLSVILYTLVAGRRVAQDNYWGAGATTLEWTVSSPPPFHTFMTLPRIASPPLAAEENHAIERQNVSP